MPVTCRAYLKHHLTGAVICQEALPVPEEVSITEPIVADGQTQEVLELKPKKRRKKRREGTDKPQKAKALKLAS